MGLRFGLGPVVVSVLLSGGWGNRVSSFGLDLKDPPGLRIGSGWVSVAAKLPGGFRDLRRQLGGWVAS